MVVRWTLEDEFTNDTVTLIFNPAEADLPSIEKKVTFAESLAGRAYAMEGAPSLGTMTFKGVTLSEAQNTQMVAIARHQRVVKLTDDLGNSWRVWVTKYTRSRVRAATRPWKMKYDMQVVVIEDLT